MDKKLLNEEKERVSISSPSSEGGGFHFLLTKGKKSQMVSISSPSSEGGGLSKS